MKKILSKKQYNFIIFLLILMIGIILTMLFLSKEVSEYFEIGFVSALLSSMIIIGLFYNKLMDYDKNQKILKIEKNIFQYESEDYFDLDKFINNIKPKFLHHDENGVSIYKYKKKLILISDIIYVNAQKNIIDSFFDKYLSSNKNGESIFSIFISDDVSSLEIIKNLTIEYSKKTIWTQTNGSAFDEMHNDPSAPSFSPFLYDTTSRKLNGYHIKGILGKTMKYLVKYESRSKEK